LSWVRSPRNVDQVGWATEAVDFGEIVTCSQSPNAPVST